MTNSLGEKIAYISTTVVALGVLWRYLARPFWRGFRAALLRFHVWGEIIERELTHNSGSSLKDAVSQTKHTVENLTGAVDEMRLKSDGTAQAVEALAQMLDAIVDRKQEDHEEMWGEIIALGGEDRRRIKRRSDD